MKPVVPTSPPIPYFIRALYEWCCDEGLTPQIVVRPSEETAVPREHVKNGEITLNISPVAVQRLQISNQAVEFSARFSGVAHHIYIPIGRVQAIFAREDGTGMVFDVDDGQIPPPEPTPVPSKPPKFTVVK